MICSMDFFSFDLNQDRTILYLKVKKENWSQHLEKNLMCSLCTFKFILAEKQKRLQVILSLLQNIQSTLNIRIP